MKENTASTQPSKQRKKRTLKNIFSRFCHDKFILLSSRKKKAHKRRLPRGQRVFRAKRYGIFYKVMLNSVFDADSIAMKPLNKLQSYLYNKGIKYIPEDDAERAF